MRKRRAFTLIELLVVIAIICLLVAILAPTLGRAKDLGQMTVCAGNHAALVKGWFGYTVDHRGKMIPSGIGTGRFMARYTYSRDDTDGITLSPLYKYVGNTKAYLCPEEQRTTTARSYSFINRLNGNEGQSFQGAFYGRSKKIKVMAEVQNASIALALVDEYDPRGRNIGPFSMTPGRSCWIDFPPVAHIEGMNLSFVDGHVEKYDPVDTEPGSAYSEIEWFWSPKAPNDRWNIGQFYAGVKVPKP